jgi:hypothetical protein
MNATKSAIGAVVGLATSFGAYFAGTLMMGGGMKSAAIVGAVAGGVGAVYSFFAFGNGVYATKFFSVAGYVLDMTWSLLNTLAGLVWMVVCKASGATLTVDDDTRRSGTFAYDKNPRGGGYDATTVGAVIAGGWSSHEETHVWQARLFGPLYLAIYVVCLGLNLLGRLVIGKTSNIVFDAYRRICWEDWAYWAGTHPGGTIKWGGWVAGFGLCLLYVALILMIPIGAMHSVLIAVIGVTGLLAYSVIRALTPA